MSRRRPKVQPIEQPCRAKVAGRLCVPAVDAFICSACMDHYRSQLADVPSVAKALREEHERRTVKGGGIAGRGSAEQPLPYVEAASRAMTRLYTALTTACRTLALGQPLPEPRVTTVCAWLAERGQSIPLRAEGPDIVVELDRCVRKALKVCDNPPEKRYVGRCICKTGGEPTRLYAQAGEDVVECPNPDCPAAWPVDERLEQLEQDLRDYRLTYAEVETVTGGRIKADRVRKWVDRGRLVRSQRGVRFGDVLGVEALLAEVRHADKDAS